MILRTVLSVIGNRSSLSLPRKIKKRESTLDKLRRKAEQERREKTVHRCSKCRAQWTGTDWRKTYRRSDNGTASDRMSELSTASSEDCFCDVDLAYGECPMCGTMAANSSSQKIS